VKKLKAMFEAIHHWIGHQPVIVQIGIAACSAFLAVAFLIAAFT
tara:strand:- start:53 stop:184 length:132 start_codon:yes stop_codon:yes gene_type:complete